LRSRKFFAFAPFAIPESSASWGTGTRNTPVPLGMKANSWPAFHLRRAGRRERARRARGDDRGSVGAVADLAARRAAGLESLRRLLE
jgi:hypothetical protein